MSVFPMNWKCDIEAPVKTRDAYGQDTVTSYSTIKAGAKCLYLDVSGNKKAIVGEVFETVMAFYVDRTVPVEEGYIIRNIRNRRGIVVRPGPFEVESAKPVPGLSGSVHHISCKLKGIT
jgi:hypothetical protein